MNHWRTILEEKLIDSITGSIPIGVSRHVPEELRFPGKATAIVGMRRVGKTMLVHQMRQERLHEGRPRWGLPFVNLEDERLVGLTAEGLGQVVEILAESFSKEYPTTPVVWSFDEIQVVQGWERLVRRLLDNGKDEVIVTGSSAALLSREIATSMRGRGWEVPLYPFSFRERLTFLGMSLPDSFPLLAGSDRSLIEGAFVEWLQRGGFPEAQRTTPAATRQLLQDYVDVVILRDVVERHDLRNIAALRWLVRHLLGNPAGTFSLQKFYGTMKSQGIAVSRDTLHQMLAHLDDSFLVRTIWMESESERQRMVNPRKTYPVDTGLIPLYDRTGRANIGHALESAVLIELQRRRMEVTWMRTAGGYEVDFLARSPEGKEFLIQVCSDATDPATAERELRGLTDGAVQRPRASLLLLTLRRSGFPVAAPADVRIMTAWEWMLEES